MAELRALTAEDWPTWRRLRLAALAEAPYAYGSRLADWQGEGDREERWRARLEIPGSYHVIAVRAGEPVGMASGVPTGAAGAVELISMWVSPAVRGRGVGDLLVRAVEAWARTVHAHTLELAVAEENGAASALYQRHGFRRVSGASRPMPDGVRREYVMAKPLRAAVWHPMDMQSVYEAAGGHEAMVRLAEAWHTRVVADEIAGHPFRHGVHPQHTERLAAYWAEALGGPAAYSGSYGDETSVVRIHSGNGEHDDMDERAIACFDLALEDAGLTAEPLRHVLHDYFAWATRTSMVRYPESADDVPDGLTIPRWSWDGLQH